MQIPPIHRICLRRLTPLLLGIICAASPILGATLPIYPGRDQVLVAVERSAPGDTILFAASGIYREADRIKARHELFFLAADTVAYHPVWQSEGVRILRLEGPATIRGIHFDGQKETRHGVRIEALKRVTVEIDNCVFTGFTEDALTDNDLPIEQVSVRESIFHDIGESALEFRTRDVLRNLVVQNTTFYNIGQFAIHVAGDQEILTARVANVTIDRSYGGVYLDKVTRGQILSSIITNCFRAAVRTTQPTFIDKICTFGNRVAYLGSSPVSGTRDVDPQYSQPREGDFSLFPSSPCLNVAGSAIGDPRWAGEASDRAWWGWFLRWVYIAGGLTLAATCLCLGFYWFARRGGRRAERTSLATQLQQSQHLEMLGTLAGGIAHDLKNTMAVVLGYLDMVQGGTDDPKQTRRISSAIEAANQANQLLRQLVRFSTGGQSERHAVDICEIIRQASRLLRPIIPPGVSIRTDLPEEPETIDADTTQIHQILMNLCQNAVDAMPSGGEIGISITPKGRDTVTLVVGDTGEGMSEEVARHIFEAFYTTKGEGEGTGLGLSVVKANVTQHGGQITVTSAPGRGTEFRIDLPRTQSETGHVTAPIGPRILVVDDDEDFLGLIRTVLTREGFAVTTFDSEVTAIEAFADNPGNFDLIVTDYVMPRLTGVELARRAREIRPGLPVILVTGYGQHSEDPNDKSFIQRIRKTQVSRELPASIRRIFEDVSEN